MSMEQSPEYFRRTLQPDEQRHQMLFDKMTEINNNPSENLVIEGALFGSVLDGYESNLRFRSLIDEFIRVRTDMTITHMSYMIRSVLQKQAIDMYGIFYPEGFDSKLKWDEVIDNITDNEPIYLEARHDLLERHLQTNIPDRYKSVVLAANWMRAHGRITNGVTIFDYGCSRNLGLKSIAAIEINRDMNGRLFHNFGPTQSAEPVDTSDITFAKELRTDEDLSDAITLAHGDPIGLKLGVGFDIENMHTPGNREWAQANLTPREHALGMAATLDMFERSFNGAHPLNDVTVLFKEEDILLGRHLDALDSAHDNQSGLADISLMITVLNQMSDIQRSKAIMRASRFTKPTGLVLIQDFARVNPDVSSELDFLDRNWNSNFSYRTIILDRMDRSGYKEIMRWNGGRAQQLNIPQTRSGEYPMLVPEHGFSPINLYDHIRQYKKSD